MADNNQNDQEPHQSPDTATQLLGIDIGTTTIVVAKCTPDGAQILSDTDGNQNWPAIFNLLTRKCGSDALQEAPKQAPENVLNEYKKFVALNKAEMKMVAKEGRYTQKYHKNDLHNDSRNVTSIQRPK